MAKLCANLTFLFTELPFLDRFAAAAEAGFDEVELAFPYDFGIDAIKARLEDARQRLVLFNTAQGDLAGGERGIAALPGREAEFRKAITAALEYATALGRPMIHVMAGIVAEGQRELAGRTFMDNLRWAAGEARIAGVQLVIEPLNRRDIPDYFVHTQSQAVDIIKAVGSVHLRLLFDIYHCQITEGDVTRRMVEHMPHIAHIQIADVPGRGEPGTGELAWRFIFNQIRNSAYSGSIGCEYKPFGSTKSGLVWRSDLGV